MRLWSWSESQDQSLFHENLVKLAEYVVVKSSALKFTKDEQRNWTAIVDAALAETDPKALPKHWRAIDDFWTKCHIL